MKQIVLQCMLNKATLCSIVNHHFAHAHEFLASGGTGIQIFKNKKKSLIKELCFKCFEIDIQKLYFFFGGGGMPLVSKI